MNTQQTSLPGLSPVAAQHLQGFSVVDQPAERDGVEIRRQIGSAFGTVRTVEIDNDAFQKWIKLADYRSLRARWWKAFAKNRMRKLLEHYASIALVQPSAGKTYLDAAANISPFHLALPITHGAKCYRQDLNLEQGVNGDLIGSDAANIPLPDQSLDGVVTHNSWEHFEGASALQFIRECIRLLKPGGKLCIIPINFATRMEIRTAPSCWEGKYRNAPDLPKFDPRATIVIHEASKQRQVLFWRPDLLKSDLDQIPGMSFELVRTAHDSATLYALVGTKL